MADPYLVMRNQQLAERQFARRASREDRMAQLQADARAREEQARAEAYWMYQQQLAQQQQQQQRADYDKQQERSDKLSAEYKAKLDEANAKNESRYLDILEGRTGTRDRVLGDLANFGQSQIRDANDRYASLRSRGMADVYSRGFGGSPSMLRSVERSAEDARGRELGRINDDLINRRVNADSGLSDSIYSFMERRNDVPPDLNQLIALQQGLGRSGPMLSMPGFTPSPMISGSTPNQFSGMPSGLAFGGRPTGSAYGPVGTRLNSANGFSSGGAGYSYAQPRPTFTPPGGGLRPEQRDSLNQYQQFLRNGQYAMHGASNNLGTSSLGQQQQINQLQGNALYGGYGNWSPAQTVTAVQGGGFGGMIGVPSMPYGVNSMPHQSYLRGNSGSGKGANYYERMARIGDQRSAYMGSGRRAEAVANMQRNQAFQDYLSGHAGPGPHPSVRPSRQPEFMFGG